MKQLFFFRQGFDLLRGWTAPNGSKPEYNLTKQEAHRHKRAETFKAEAQSKRNGPLA